MELVATTWKVAVAGTTTEVAAGCWVMTGKETELLELLKELELLEDDELEPEFALLVEEDELEVLLDEPDELDKLLKELEEELGLLDIELELEDDDPPPPPPHAASMMHVISSSPAFINRSFITIENILIDFMFNSPEPHSHHCSELHSHYVRDGTATAMTTECFVLTNM